MSKKIAIKNPKNKPDTADDWVDTRDKKKRLTIDIPMALHTKLKITAAKRNETMGEMISNILEENFKET